MINTNIQTIKLINTYPSTKMVNTIAWDGVMILVLSLLSG